MRLFHGTDKRISQFIKDPDFGYEDGGVSFSTRSEVGRCYGPVLMTIEVPDSALKLKRITARDWFTLSDEEILGFKKIFDGLLIEGDPRFNSEPDADFQPEDATFFWDWMLIWNVDVLNRSLVSVQDMKTAGRFEDLPYVGARMAAAR